MDKIPDSAAVHEAVEQGKQYANPRAAGLENGRPAEAIRRGESWPNPDLAPVSHPQPLVEAAGRRNGTGGAGGGAGCGQPGAGDGAAGEPLWRGTALKSRQPPGGRGLYGPIPGLERFLIAGAGNLERLEIYQKACAMSRTPLPGWQSSAPG